MPESAYVHLPAFGCVVWLDDGTLYTMEANTFREGGYDINYRDGVEVTAPESQAFLDAVNDRYATSFELDQFAGR